MRRLFCGLVFVLLDLNVRMGTAGFDVLPDFIGYYLVMTGMEQLSRENPRFQKSRHAAFGLMIAGVIVFGAGLMNPDAIGRVWLWGLELGMLAVLLSVLRQVVLALGDMGKETQKHRLYGFWQVLAVMLPLCHGAGWIPLVGTICSLVSAGLNVLFLLMLYTEIKNSAA